MIFWMPMSCLRKNKVIFIIKWILNHQRPNDKKWNLLSIQTGKGAQLVLLKPSLILREKGC